MKISSQSYDKSPIHQQKCQKGKVTTQTTSQKSSITQWLRTDLGRSVGVTTATQLVYRVRFTEKSGLQFKWNGNFAS